MSKTPNILKQIIQRKVEEIEAHSKQISLRELSHLIANCPPPRGFVEAINARLQLQQPAVIAEIKKASPSKGVLRENFDPVAIAKSYEQNGAACLSVLTDKYFFQGADEYLSQVHETCMLPLLRKDFIIDAYQVYEARAIGADCILLIVAALGDAQLHDLADLATHLGMDVLVEVHDREELERAQSLNTRLIGINNRNLRTFHTQLKTTLELLPWVPKKHIVVSESGIHTPADVALLRQADVHAFLVGEAFMKADDPGVALQNLFE
ncbi:MAG TPA: indole-3-glycerol phosphate synthase TrpC [Thioploca sp.]|nr:MAG: indole-3-glycerol-phosphate synthase [Beggiatoa sp. 4572_84]RKZ54116.1 MAG: indole-3-glycerol phosphate synthase TrpC [Gammaproteobacteria bacterium]HDN26365.1 indole-3-glycerol phosphate synthase TrpC [Thioploca sp.]